MEAASKLFAIAGAQVSIEPNTCSRFIGLDSDWRVHFDVPAVAHVGFHPQSGRIGLTVDL
ncbi:hypothetical protein D9M68_328110 [compost metagenome]